MVTTRLILGVPKRWYFSVGRWRHKNDVRFVFTSSCLLQGSWISYVICVCLRILLSTTYCVVFLFCFSSSCVPYVASSSGMSIFGLPLQYSLTFIVTRGGDTRSDVFISWFPWRPNIFEMKSYIANLPDAKWPHMGVKALSKIWNSVKVSSSQLIKYGSEQVLYSWKRL